MKNVPKPIEKTGNLSALMNNSSKEPESDDHEASDFRDVNNWMQNGYEIFQEILKDYGEMLENTELEQNAKWLSNVFRYAMSEDITDIEAQLGWQQIESNANLYVTALLRFVQKYDHSITLSEFKTQAIMTKYYIRLGSILNLIKKIVKKRGERWEDWKNQNLPPNRKRSYSDYMRIAKIPNSIKYAFLCIDRLLYIDRAVKKQRKGDPIKEFMNRHQITINPIASEDIDNFKDQVDTGILKDKIERQANHNGVEVDLDNATVAIAIDRNLDFTKGDIQYFLDRVERDENENQAFEEICEAKTNEIEYNSSNEHSSDIIGQVESLEKRLLKIYNSTELSVELEVGILRDKLNNILDLLSKI